MGDKTMTKKHFKALAESFKNLNTQFNDISDATLVERNSVYKMLRDFCREQNANFDEGRFYNACHGLPYKK